MTPRGGVIRVRILPFGSEQYGVIAVLVSCPVYSLLALFRKRAKFDVFSTAPSQR